MGSSFDRRRMSRRGFLLGAGAGLAAGLPLGLGWRGWHPFGEAASPFTGKIREDTHPDYAMPGPFPGRVIEVHHPGSVKPDHTISAGAVKSMMDRGMRELTGADHPIESWRRFFEVGDVVGIKVNPVGRKPPGDSRAHP